MTPKKNDNEVPSICIDLLYEKIMSNKVCLENLPSTVSIENLPNWYDRKLFKRGQEYARRNLASITTSGIMGLLVTFTMPDIRILEYTKNSNSSCAAFKRYLQTIIHIFAMYLDDIDDPNSKWWKSLNTIRWKHATVAQKAKKDNIEFPKLEMVLTQFGFVGYVLLNPKELGFTNEPEYQEGFVHLWRVIGYLIGIPDEINLCQNNAAETTDLCKKILNDFYIDCIKKRSKGSDDLIKSVLDGLWYVDSTVNYDATMCFWYELNGLKYEKPLGFYSQFRYMQKKAILYLLGIQYVQHPLRYALNYATHIILWIAEHCPIFAWMKFGKQNSKISMYPIPFENHNK